MDLCRNLVGLVGRAFYEPKEAIILDLLTHNPFLRDDELSIALSRMNPKELQKICARLKIHGMLQVKTRLEEVAPAKPKTDSQPLLGPNGKPLLKERFKRHRSYYYIDYKLFVNVVKYKIYMIGKNIGKDVEQQMTQLPYKCVTCDKQFEALEMLTLEMTEDNIPLCDICKSEVVLDESVDSNKSSEQYTLFMNETLPIVEVLKKLDKFVVPDSTPVLPPIGGETTPQSATGTDISVATNRLQEDKEQTIVVEFESPSLLNTFSATSSESLSITDGLPKDSSLNNYYANLVNSHSVEQEIIIPQ